MHFNKLNGETVAQMLPFPIYGYNNVEQGNEKCIQSHVPLAIQPTERQPFGESTITLN